jgi:hypothetical protein
MAKAVMTGRGEERQRGAQHTSISRKFSGGPYISSKDCCRVSGMDCIIGLCSLAAAASASLPVGDLPGVMLLGKSARAGVPTPPPASCSSCPAVMKKEPWAMGEVVSIESMTVR